VITIPRQGVVKLGKRQAGAPEAVAERAAQDFVLFADQLLK
jgi:hypothetical protein